jgi:hypothetical protein
MDGSERTAILITASATTARAPTAAAAATTVSAAPSPTSTSTAASTPATAFARRPRLVYDHAPAHEVVAIERLNGAAGIVITIHFDEAEPARLTRETVAHQSNIRRRNAHLRKPIA